MELIVGGIVLALLASIGLIVIKSGQGQTRLSLSLPDSALENEVEENVKSWRFRVAGGSYPSREGGIDRASVIKSLKQGQTLSVMREPHNEFDFNCICIYLKNEGLPDIDVGFVPKGTARILASLIDRRAEFEWKGEVVRQGAGGHFAYLYVTACMTKAPELKHRPRKDAILKRDAD